MIDILLAVYNGKEFLMEQLESIANQSYTDWRLIIRDDCSTDNSYEVAKIFAKRYSKDKVYVYRNEKASGSAKNNFFLLLEDATSDYVMFCDQDDVWLPTKIEKTMKHMQQLEQRYGKIPLLVHTDLYVVDEDLKIISTSMRAYQNLPVSTSMNQLMIQNSVTGCTVMINRTLVDMMCRKMKTQNIVMHDYWAALIASALGKIDYIEEPLIKYRQHHSNSVGAMNAKGATYLWQRFCAGREVFRQRLNETMIQMGYFCHIFARELENHPQKQLFEGYSRLRGKGKIEKYCFYISQNVMKYGIIRKIMQFLWV